MLSKISKESFQRLQSFSDTANRTTPHWADVELWCDFLLSIYTEDQKLHVDDLTEWLIDQKWPKEEADRLGLQYEFAMDLLSRQASTA